MWDEFRWLCDSHRVIFTRFVRTLSLWPATQRYGAHIRDGIQSLRSVLGE